jgi:pre-mRNA-processing factor SLU7
VHVNSNPTAADLAHKEFQEKKEKLNEKTASSMLSKYGGEEYLKKAPKELLSGQAEEYVEYSRTGQIVRGQERAKAKSKYDEDGMFFFKPKYQYKREAYFVSVF